VTRQKWSGAHRRLSEQMRARAIGQACHYCSRPMLPGQPLDLDHAPDGRANRAWRTATATGPTVGASP
jgi:hypothetical protein